MRDLEKILVNANSTIEEAMLAMENNGLGIVLVVDRSKQFLGTVTDGDIRRAILNRMPLDTQVHILVTNNKVHEPGATVAPHITTADKLLQTMNEKKIRHIPLLDEQGAVVDLAVLSELVGDPPPTPLAAVIMAGGMGKRMLPLTEHMPKPMLPLNNQPMLERIVEQLRRSGIKKIYISTNYKSEAIVNYFGDGKKFDVEIGYINEDKPLGTAGSLSLLEATDDPILVINGDILTQLDFRSMFQFHRSHKAVLTVGLRFYEVNIPFGVIQTDDVKITDLIEKPNQSVTINAGIYLLEPEAHKAIPQGLYSDMTELINKLIKEGHHVIGFPIPEYWLDVGRPSDYRQANEDTMNGKI